MSIPFGIEWAPAFRELADISQIIFTVGPILLLGIFLIIKIKSKQQDEDILYKLTQLELLAVDLGFGLPRSRNGNPAPAADDKILQRFAQMCAPYGVEMEICGNVATVKLDA